MRIANLSAWSLAGVTSLWEVLGGALAMAQQPIIGQPVDGDIGFQPAVTVVAHDIHWLDDFVMIIGGAISLFVVVLLALVVIKFNRKANPVPAKFTHNAVLEVVWTAIPVLILVIIAIPSLRLLFLQLDVPPHPDLTIKATGNQWYWSYSYPEQKIDFDSIMVAGGYSTWGDVMKAAAKDTPDGKALKQEIERTHLTKDTWHLQPDNVVVVPVNAIVHVLVTGADVIHSWTVPSFGVKIDAVPGRLNDTWFKAEKTGLYFGQCSELCGKGHAYMPIAVSVVTKPEFDAWVKKQHQASRDVTPTTQVAQK